MRHRWLASFLVIILALSLHPVSAEVVEVKFRQDPILTLDEAETQRLNTLQRTSFPALMSDISPDDTTIVKLLIAPDQSSYELYLMDINSGESTSYTQLFNELPPFSNLAWRDAHTLVYISFSFEVGPALVALNRVTGEVSLEPVSFSGAPISLAPNGSRLLVARTISADDDEEIDFAAKMRSPFKHTVKRTFDRPASNARFDAERQALQVAEDEVVFSVVDLSTGESRELFHLPSDSGLLSEPSWTRDGAKLALVHITVPEISRRGTELSNPANQDALGNLAPADNPFLQSNAISIFDFPNNDMRPWAIPAKDGNGDMFGQTSWSTDNQTLMAQMWHPSSLAGRKHPTYLYPDRSYLRFYNAALEPIGTFESPQTQAAEVIVPRFISPDEVLINTVYGLSDRLYYYNRISGEFRQISLWDGTYYQAYASNLSRQIIFNFSSYQQAPDLYRITWEGTALSRLTWHNGEAESVNKVRTDRVNFTMQNGAVRQGYLIQPADAAFPPRNVPIVVWQEGGPGGSMVNQWGGQVERPFNILPNFGIAVLVLPLPGRDGFGPAFYRAQAEGNNFGSIDIDEAAQAVRQMIARGWTSKGKIGVSGCSYGGYFTAQSLVRHPDLYAAANTQCSLLDLFTEWELGYTPFLSYLEGRAPTTDPNEYLRDSPIYNATKIRTPLLIFAGTNDFLPVTISHNLHDQIATTKTPVKFLKFELEGHGLSLLQNQSTAAQAQISWFREYLGGNMGKFGFNILSRAH